MIPLNVRLKYKPTFLQLYAMHSYAKSQKTCTGLQFIHNRNTCASNLTPCKNTLKSIVIHHTLHSTTRENAYTASGGMPQKYRHLFFHYQSIYIQYWSRYTKTHRMFMQIVPFQGNWMYLLRTAKINVDYLSCISAM